MYALTPFLILFKLDASYSLDNRKDLDQLQVEYGWEQIKQRNQTVSDINIIILSGKSSILLDSAESIPRDSSVDCVLNERENSPRVTRNAVEWI